MKKRDKLGRFSCEKKNDWVDEWYDTLKKENGRSFDIKRSLFRDIITEEIWESEKDIAEVKRIVESIETNIKIPQIKKRFSIVFSGGVPTHVNIPHRSLSGGFYSKKLSIDQFWDYFMDIMGVQKLTDIKNA